MAAAGGSASVGPSPIGAGTSSNRVPLEGRSRVAGSRGSSCCGRASAPDRFKVLRDRPTAKDAGLRVAVVEIDARVSLPGATVSIEVGLGRPWAFGQEHAVVFEQGALAVMQLGDLAVVVDQRAGIRHLGVGQPSLSVEQLIEGDGAGIVGCLNRFHLTSRRHTAIEVGLG